MDKKTFEKERAAWNSQNLKNYQFTYEFFNDAGPIGPLEITVGKNEDTNDEVIAKSITEIYDFIEGTFDFIEEVKNGTYSGYKIISLTLQISYDAQYHYPKEVKFSEGYAESVDGGGYYTLKITEFIPMD
jgi:hypothetical protein